ncbi:MAG: DUF3786 domain-containing protein [Thermoplasmata archaeon]|nr:DUF3786 domain-containing protein [Thermoplasmata archaeon]
MIDRLRTGGKQSHHEALERAWDEVSEIDSEVLASDLGRPGDGTDGKVRLSLLGDPLVVDVDGRTIRYDREGGADLSRYLQVLVLHFLSGVGKSPLTNRLMSFRELEGGALYYPAFKARAIDPLVKAFGYKPELLKRVANSLGAEPLSIGHVSFRLHFFEKMPVAVVLWLGDVEVSASASILFDASAGKMLATEDLTVVGGMTSRTLIKNSQQ